MRVLTALALCLVTGLALAQAPGPGAALEREVAQAFAAGDYETAAAKCRELIALAPEQAEPHYNLACALARQGETAAALESLERAVELGYDDAAHLRSDADLESLRGEEAFAKIAAAAEARRAEAVAKLYEPGKDLEGVRTVEGNPPGGLRWRVRISPAATAEEPHRLVVWLHPSGGSMNRVAEALAPDLSAHGFALLVPTAKPWMSWSGAEAQALLAVTLPDAAEKVEGLDVAKPLLMGFSAGGQMALNLWEEDASRFGGLVLDAAYPIDAAAYRERRIEPMALPPGDAVQEVPLFVLVGDADGGHRVWKQVEEPWRAAGLDLTVHYVPNGRHAWLLDTPRKEALLAWLDERWGGKPEAD